MTLDIEGIRPAVLSKETASILDEYRSFRHVVRNIYGFEMQLRDVRHMLQGVENIDHQYLAHWARKLQVSDLMNKALVNE
jgi:hypothetical protein